MEKYIPYEKLSKQKKRVLNLQKRNTWGAINPVTRKPQNQKAYRRKKAQPSEDDPSHAESFIIFQAHSISCPKTWVESRLFFTCTNGQNIL